jgi:NADPH:quinone reductase-like Zn-dependent oxidoreductase
MASIAQLLAKGKLHTHITKVYPFTAMGEAHTQVQTGKTRGKIILKI